jgi:hypothetical protein
MPGATAEQTRGPLACVSRTGPFTRARHIGPARTVALRGHLDLDSAQIDSAQIDSAQMKRIRMTTDHETGARSDTDRQEPATPAKPSWFTLLRRCTWISLPDTKYSGWVVWVCRWPCGVNLSRRHGTDRSGWR